MGIVKERILSSYMMMKRILSMQWMLCVVTREGHWTSGILRILVGTGVLSVLGIVMNSS